MPYNPPLPVVQLCLYCRGYQEPLLRHAQAFDVFAGSRKGDLEVAHFGTEERLIEPMVEHLVPHPAKAAAALLDAVKVGEALGQDRIARAWPVFSLAQTGERDWFRRKARAGKH